MRNVTACKTAHLSYLTYLGVSTTRLPQHNEVSECIARVSSNPRVAFQTMLLMEVRKQETGRPLGTLVSRFVVIAAQPI